MGLMTRPPVLLQGLNTSRALACGSQSLDVRELLSLGVGGTGFMHSALSPRRRLFPAEPLCYSATSRGPAWWAHLLHSIGWPPGSWPPGLAGIGSPEDEACPGTACVLSSPAATCLDGWERLSSALNYPGMGLPSFLSDKEPCLIARVTGSWERSLGDQGIS